MNHVHVSSPVRRGFSLIELLMAIFILGIGLISIASLFPAGISMQQRAEDEINGPIVAQTALEVLRGRLSAEDFGSWRDFLSAQIEHERWRNGDDAATALEQSVTADLFNLRNEQPAAWLDAQTWPWMRPAMITSVSDPQLAETLKPGTVDVFNALEFAGLAESIGEHTLADDHPWRRMLGFRVRDASNQPVTGLPFHPRHIVMENELGLRLPEPYLSPPRVLITPEERSWPPVDATGRKPLYYWDFAVRRSGSGVQVAIFVYRVKRESISQPAWSSQPIVDPRGLDQAAIPVPWVVDLNEDQGPFAPWWAGLQEGLPGTEPDQFIEPGHPDYGWYWPGQWLVDQVGNLHRIAAGRTEADVQSSFAPVSLTSPVTAPAADFQLDRLDLDADGRTDDPQVFTASVVLPAASMSEMNRPEHFETGMVRNEDLTAEGMPVVDRLWYVPPVVTTEAGFTYRLLPIYVTVADL